MYGKQVQVYCGGNSCEPDYAKMIAHWAKMELLKEKVKLRMEKKHGKELDKLADLIIEVVEERAKSVDELEKKEEELDEAFYQFGSEEGE